MGAYDLEDALLRSRRIATFELPLDVAFAAGAAAAGFLTVYFYSSLTLAEPDRSDQMQTAIANLVTVPGDCDHCCSPAVVSAQATGRSIGRLCMVAGQARPAARHRPRPLTPATQAGA